MIYIGIDPGKTGGIAVIEQLPTYNELMYLERFDRKKIAIIMNRIKPYKEVAIVIERAQAMSKQGRAQGVVSMFNYGLVTGFWYGVFESIFPNASLIEVPPQKWQYKYFSRIGESKTTKELSVAKANELYPDAKIRKQDHGLADALLLADFGLRYPDAHPEPRIKKGNEI